jgi:hypothetical protein
MGVLLVLNLCTPHISKQSISVTSMSKLDDLAHYIKPSNAEFKMFYSNFPFHTANKLFSLLLHCSIVLECLEVCLFYALIKFSRK